MVAESIHKKHVVGIPYIHCLSHRLKKGSWYSVNVFSTAANKLGKICAAMQRMNEQVIDKSRTDVSFVKFLLVAAASVLGTQAIVLIKD